MAKMTGVRQRCPKDCPRQTSGRCRVHRWEFTVELPPGDNGRRRQVTKAGFATAADAATARAEVLRQHREGTLPDLDRRRVTVAQFLRGWLAGRAVALRPRTLESYTAHVEMYVVPTIGAVRMVDLRPEHVEAMLRVIRRNREERGQAALTGATERRIIATLRNACGAAIKQGLITRDPTLTVEVRKDPGHRVNPWTWREFEVFEQWLAARAPGTASARLAPLVAVVARTGLRLGEVCGLRWVDVDLDGGMLTVRQQAQVIGTSVVYAPPKSRESTDREVPLVPDAVAALRSHRKRQAGERLQWGPAWQDTGLVFTREDGAGLNPSAVSAAFLAAVRASAVRRTRFHDLRHLAATHMLRQGVPLVHVSRVLGHSSTAITGSTYNHVVAADAKEFMTAAFGRRDSAAS